MLSEREMREKEERGGEKRWVGGERWREEERENNFLVFVFCSVLNHCKKNSLKILLHVNSLLHGKE